MRPACMLYRVGKPIETLAVFDKTLASAPLEELPQPFSTELAHGSLKIKYPLASTDALFGLGENMGRMNKRGRVYRMYATDKHHATPDQKTLYGSHPFLLFTGTTSWGLFIDYPGEIVIDAGATDRNMLEISLPTADADVYFFQGKDHAENIASFLRLTGTPYVPPRWGFGYHQSRWGYPDRATVENIAHSFRHHDIPCDAIYLDLDYMDNFRVFTTSETFFPNFENFATDLKKQGIRLVAIVDPGVKIEPGYNVYEQGCMGDHFCKTASGSRFVGAVWPGLVHFPDFLNEKTKCWWGSLYKRLTQKGIAGFWNDMNEPSIFFTPEAFKHNAETLSKYFGQFLENNNATRKETWENADWRKLWEMENVAHKMGQDPDYYEQFFHQTDSGQSLVNKDVHNLYGFHMALGTAAGLQESAPGERHFLITRSSAIGAHRVSGVWTGDNASWWEHLRDNIVMVASLGVCGFFYSGADIGGFGSQASAELLVRWTQLGIFTPLMRNHSALDTRPQEPWAFDSETMALVREAIRLRYALLPFLYSEYLHAVDELFPVFSGLYLHYDGREVSEIDDQFFVGRNLMVAPVCQENARRRMVYLPPGNWLHWNAAQWDKREARVLSEGYHSICADIGEIPLFLRENSILPLQKPHISTNDPTPDEITLLCHVAHRATYLLWDDDGHSLGKTTHCAIEFSVEKSAEGWKASALVRANGCPRRIPKVAKFDIRDTAGNRTQMEIPVQEIAK